ncbi:MAG: glycosyltransferase family 2 protein [Actinomycetota bacterium]
MPDGTASGPLVSVLIPIYNRERYVPGLVRTLAGQTYPRWEAVVVDDGSTDGTVDALEREAGRDERIRVLRQDHLGGAGFEATYRRALGEARGDLVTLLDSDDTWPPDKLALQVEDFTRPEVALSFGDYDWIDERDRPIRRVNLARHLPRQALANDPPGVAAWLMAGLAYRTITFPCATVVRRSALERAGGIRALGQVGLVDFPTFLRLSLEGPFAYHERVLGSWRIHDGALTTFRRELIARASYEHAVAFLREHPQVVRGDATETEERWRAVIERETLADALARMGSGEWRDASRTFRRLARGGSRIPTRAAAMAGVTAATLHVDLDPVVRLMRRTREPRVEGNG